MELKAGSLEYKIIDAGVRLHNEGHREFHASGIADFVSGSEARAALIGHGTLHKALRRLEGGGLLTSRMEDFELARSAGRPRHRLYTVTGDGARALANPAPARRYAFIPSGSRSTA